MSLWGHVVKSTGKIQLHNIIFQVYNELCKVVIVVTLVIAFVQSSKLTKLYKSDIIEKHRLKNILVTSVILAFIYIALV